jgi:hypothetical protein
MRRLLPLALALLIPSAASAVDLPPALGAVAPAFGLHPFVQDAEGGKKALFLDHQCGIQQSTAKAVLITFVNSGSKDDLGTLNSWARTYAEGGLSILAVSNERNGDAFGNTVRKANYKFPVLDDRYGVVAHRYGVDSPPRTYLLNSDCMVVRSWSRPVSAIASEIEKDVGAVLAGELGRVLME